MKWWDEDHLKGKDNGLPLATRNPWCCSDDLFKYAASARWLDESKVGDVECKIVQTQADAAGTEGYIKRLVQGNVNAVDGMPEWNWMSVYDAKNSNIVYRAWIGKQDLLIWKMEWVLVMGIDKSKYPALELPDNIRMAWTFEISDFDKELDLKLPAEVKRRFGVKEDP